MALSTHAYLLARSGVRTINRMVDGSGWEMEYEGRYVVPSLLPNL
jgi:hypothetical protein